MQTAYIGTKYDGHDTAVFMLLPHCAKAFGLSTERITRVKHDSMFPFLAMSRLFSEAREPLTQVRRVHCVNSFSSHKNRIYPVERLSAEIAARGMDITQCVGVIPSTSPYERLDETIRRHLISLLPLAEISVSHVDHEYCHARSAYDLSPYQDALVLTLDGSGDHGTFSRAYLGSGGELSLISSSASADRLVGIGPHEGFSKPCSIGGIFSYFTYILGFEPNSEEGKLEALAAFGRPLPTIREALLDAININGETRAIKIDARKLREVCFAPAMLNVSEVMRPDLAATVQTFMEDVVTTYVSKLLIETGAATLCVSGGVFANVTLNRRLAELVKNRIYVAPAMGDDGSAQGAALAAMVQDQRVADRTWLRSLNMPYFGTSYTPDMVRKTLDQYDNSLLVRSMGEDDLINEVAERLAAGQIGGIFRGCMEFGPRALGNRSIVASGCNKFARDRINRNIKRRPSFQPVCPAVLDEEMERLFLNAYQNKHMTCAFVMRPQYRDLLQSTIHVDGTARAQFVSPDDNFWLWTLLKRIKAIEGFGVIINTSFNVHGKAIVESPHHAISDFMNSGMDFLAIEGFLVVRKGTEPFLFSRTADVCVRWN